MRTSWVFSFLLVTYLSSPSLLRSQSISSAPQVPSGGPASFVSCVTSGFLNCIGATQSASGTPPSNVQLLNAFNFNSLNITDSIDAASTTGGFASGFTSLVNTSTGITGQHIGILGEIIVGHTPTTAGNYVGVWGFSSATINLGGTNTGAGAAGKIFGMNPQVAGAGTATNLLEVAGAEVDVSCGSGCTTKNKIGVNISTTASDATQGATVDAAIVIGAYTTSPGWQSGILFNNFNGGAPISSTGTMIGANNVTPLYGIDLSGITFSAGGAPFLAPLTTPASSSATCKQGSIEWDASFVYICTATNTWKRAALSTF